MIKIGKLEYDMEYFHWNIKEKYNNFLTKVHMPFDENQKYNHNLDGKEAVAGLCSDNGNWYVIAYNCE